MASQASVLSGSWFDQDDRSRLSVRLKRTLVLSLVLHVAVLLVAVGVRLPQRGERPLNVFGSVAGQSVDAREADRVGQAVESAKFQLRSRSRPVCRASIGREKKGHVAGSSASADAPKFGDLSLQQNRWLSPNRRRRCSISHVSPDAAQDPPRRFRSGLR